MTADYQRRRNAAAEAFISAISDDILIDCLSRLPSSSLVAAAKVCRRWSILISSAAFAAVHGHFTIFAITLPSAPIVAARFRIGLDHSWQKVLLPSAAISAVDPAQLISIRRSIYILGRAATLLYDPLTGKITEKMAMSFRRRNFAAAVISGKIYVAGGTTDTAAVEAYDPDYDSWAIVAAAPRRRCCCFGAAVGGVFHIIGGLKVREIGSWKDSDKDDDGLHYECSLDMYDVYGGAWLGSREIPGGGCVVAACSAGTGVFVLMSHWVELSFWRMEGGACGGDTAEEEGWRRLRSPPVPTKISLQSKTRFSCVGNGDEIALVQAVGYMDDLLVLKGKKPRGYKVGLVLVYDVAGDEWRKVAELPTFSPRAVCGNGGRV